MPGKNHAKFKEKKMVRSKLWERERERESQRQGIGQGSNALAGARVEKTRERQSGLELTNGLLASGEENNMSAAGNDQGMKSMASSPVDPKLTKTR